MSQLLAYHGRQDLKDRVLAMIAEHERADRLVKGTYADLDGSGAFKGGCAVGCTLESIREIEGLSEIQHDAHALYERYLGVPRVLARLEDALFESLPDEEALAWPRRFTAAIRPGADLSMVWPRFLHRLLSDPDGGVQRGAARRPRSLAAVQTVVDLYGRWIDGALPTLEDWRAAYRTAADAAADAAYASSAAAADAASSAAYGAHEHDHAADAAADAAATAAAAAAYTAVKPLSAHDARLRERRWQANLLISLLETS